MPQKPKTRKDQSAAKSKSRSARESASETGKSQSERFIETARAIGVDESGREFERTLRKIVKPRAKIGR
jgi:hypothetical protein